MPEPENTTRMTDAPVLVGIAYAAHRAGDRVLERTARRELEEEHGIVLRFKRKHTTKQAEK